MEEETAYLPIISSSFCAGIFSTALKIRLHRKFKLINKDFFDSANVILLVKYQHCLFIVLYTCPCLGP